MNIDEFCTQFGDNVRSIDDVMRNWQLEEIEGLLRTAREQHDQLIGSAVIVGDALHGGTLLDEIPKDLKDAFVQLMHKKADTYEKMRQILLEKVRADDGGFLPWNDPHVVGFISKLKGQIGENHFQHHTGSAAVLAESGSQEGWDVAVKQADGAYEYVQVKLHADPHGIVRHMLKVQKKVEAELIKGFDGETTVKQIDFAVPADTFERVNQLKDRHSELDSMHIRTIPIDSHRAAGIVKEGMSHIGPDQLSHFFHELLGGAVAAGSLHAIVNGFLWYKGAKEFSEAFAGAAASTTISTTGIGIGLVVETLCHTAVFSSAVGIGSRLFLGRLARSRWSFAEFLEKSIAGSEARTAALRQMFRAEPITA
ncbi:MAG TPA: hypothetical protein VND64_36750 [Pirellulales bacterium]|nr:hypothetical protein [Pirellulales bacterium]